MLKESDFNLNGNLDDYSYLQKTYSNDLNNICFNNSFYKMFKLNLNKNKNYKQFKENFQYEFKINQFFLNFQTNVKFKIKLKMLIIQNMSQ